MRHLASDRAAASTPLSFGLDGEVGKLSRRDFTWPATPSDSDMPYGVLIAIAGSNRFLSNDPKAFYRDELGTSKFIAGGNDLRSFLFARLINKNSLGGGKSGKKITYHELKGFMDKAPSFTQKQWDEFWNECKDLSDGLQRVCKAIGMGSLAMVALSVTPDLDHNKARFVHGEAVQYADDDDGGDDHEDGGPTPDPISLLGAIYRTLVEELFNEQYAALPSKQPHAQGASRGGKRPINVTSLDTDDDDDDDDDDDVSGYGGSGR